MRSNVIINKPSKGKALTDRFSKLYSALSAALAVVLLTPVGVNAATLEEIVVTAQKRSQSLQDVPVSVAVVSGEKINDSGMNDMMDLSASLPNIKIVGAVNNQNVFIRGIGSGIDRGLEQSVGMFIDGIYMGRSRQYKAPFLDLDRVEVLYGPQAVLFGKNTVAGAVKVETAKADLDDKLSGSLFVEFDPDYGDTRVNGVVNSALSDTFAVRLAASSSQGDGYFEDTFKGQDELQSDEDVFRLSATWQPSDVLTARTKFDYAKSDTVGSLPSEISVLDTSPTGFADPSAALTAPVAGYLAAVSMALDPDLNAELDYKKSTNNTLAALGENERQSDEIMGAMLHLDYQMGGHTLTSITGYSEYESNEWQDVDFLPIDLLAQNNREDFDQLSQEIRLTSPGGETFDYIVGAYWQDSSLALPFTTSFDMRTLSPFLELVPDLAAFAPVMTTVTRVTDYQLDTTSWSAFAEVSWNLSEDFQISLGGRYSDEQKDVSSSTPWVGLDNQPVDSLEELTTVGLLAALGVAANSPGEDSRSETHFSPSLKLNWHLNDNSMAYASAQRGFKSGGFNSAPDVGLNGSEFEYEEEQVTGYEAGIKSTLLDGAATFNIAYFYSEFDDLQVTSFVGTTFLLSNAGSSISQGVEMDAKWAVTDNLTLSSAISMLNAEYDEYVAGPCTIAQQAAALDSINCEQDLSGKTTPYAPDWSGNFDIDYVTSISDSLELSTNLSLIYSDEFFYDGALDENTLQDAYTKLNARIALGSVDGNWEVAIAGNNLTDETTVFWGSNVPLVAGSFLALVDAPRTVALQGRYNF